MAKFEKGQSGNPGGRPKANISFTKLAKEHSEDALRVLVDALSSNNEKNRLMAANMLLDRAYGKPTQQVDGMNMQQVVMMSEVKKGDKPLRYNIGTPNTSKDTEHTE